MIRKVLFITALSVNFIFGWGTEGHKLINKKALEILPAEFSAFNKYSEYITEHAPDPDFRKKEDPTEPTKHFIDIDYYKEYKNGSMIEDRDSLTAIYKDSVDLLGTLPWATMTTFNKLVEAFKEKNRDKVLILAADLGHYVADGHQPMHTMVNYNGQLSGQKGIHARYEIEMVNRHLTELDTVYDNCSVKKIENPLKFIFNYIFNANSIEGDIYAADKDIASKHPDFGDEYYRLLWFKTNYITKIQIRSAAEDLAAFYYTAWLNAGKPNINELK